MKAAELTELDEPRDDHLHVGVRGMVPEVDERKCTIAELARAVITRAPVIQHRRVKGRLVELVLDEQAPAVRQGAINRSHAVEIAIQRPAKMELAGEIPAIADPHSVRLRPERSANLETFEVVLDRLPPHGRVGVAQAAKLVRAWLPWLILKSVRIRRFEKQPACLSDAAQLAGILRS